MKKITSTILLLVMLYILCGISTGNAANTSDISASLSEEGAVYGDEFPKEAVAFTLDMCKNRIDEFAWLITQTRFDDAVKYLHPTLYNALNGDFVAGVGKSAKEIFLTTPIGICPDYCSVQSDKTIEADLWAQKMDDVTEKLGRLGITIDFDSSRVLEYHYTFGKLYEGSSKYANLIVYAQDDVVIRFIYINEN